MPLTVITLVIALATAAQADSVKVSGFWIDNVTVETITEGQIVFTTNTGGRVQQPLNKLTGLKVDAYPALAEAETALENENFEDAASKLQAVREEADEPWLDQYVSWRLVQARSSTGDAVGAVEVYASLVRGGAEAHFLQEPPVKAVRAADGADKQAIVRTVQTAKQRVDSTAFEKHLQPLLDAASADTAADGDAGEPAQPAGADGSADDSAGGDSAVVLPSDIENDTTTNHLRDGEFDAALESVQQTLAGAGTLSLGLYQKGMAELGKAENTGDTKMYKNAGLSFMRVIAYFPNSRYVGPALVEIGYVHAKIGRTDKARDLYNRARNYIGEEDNPDYHARLMKLLESLEN